MTKKILIWFSTIVLFVVIVFIAVGLYVVISGRTPAPIVAPPVNINTNITPYTLLIKNNPLFVRAEHLKASGDYTTAAIAYRTALSDATSTAQKVIIKYYIANIMVYSGNYSGAIQLLKQIAGNNTYSPIQRSYAVEKMGQIFYATLSPTVTKEIFKDPPYHSLFVNGNIALSYKNLFNYSISISPIALSELHVANWYATNLNTLYKKTASSSKTTTDLNLIQGQIGKVNNDVERYKRFKISNGHYMPPILLLKAVVLGKLSHIGMASSTDVEAVFKSALTAYTVLVGKEGGVDGKARYRYASFLANTYGSKRVADIQDILRPLYTNPIYRQSLSAVFFKNAQNNLRVRPSVIRLALLDNGFENYLISLGWSASDFVNQNSIFTTKS